MPNCHLHKLLGCLCRRLFYLLADIVIDDTRLQHIEHLHLIISFEEFEELRSNSFTLSKGTSFSKRACRNKEWQSASLQHRTVLGLHQQTGILLTLVDGERSNRVHIAAELGECFQFAILCLVYLQRTRHLLHCLNLGVTATRLTEIPTSIAGRLPG